MSSMTKAETRIERLTRRPQFLAVAKSGRKAATAGLVLQVMPRAPEAGSESGDVTRVGFTASKKVGNAVKRNRAKRRLRAACRVALAPNALTGHDYVLIAREETVTRRWSLLLGDVEQALRRARAWANRT